MNDFASLSADFTTPHFSADLPPSSDRSLLFGNALLCPQCEIQPGTTFFKYPISGLIGRFPSLTNQGRQSFGTISYDLSFNITHNITSTPRVQSPPPSASDKF